MGESPRLSARWLLTCQVLSPWKKKKSAKPHTTEVQTMQSRGMSLIRSPLRSCGEGGEPEGQIPAQPVSPPALHATSQHAGWILQEAFRESHPHLAWLHS